MRDRRAGRTSPVSQASGFPATFAELDIDATYAAICVIQDDIGQFGRLASAVLDDHQGSYIAAWD